MAESKQVTSPDEEPKNLTTTLQDVVEDEDDEQTLVPEPSTSTTKSKKKKKKSKLKSLLSHKPTDDIPLQEVQDAISSVSLEERKELSSEEQKKFEMVIKKMNEMLPGGRKDIADHKFWKTQPVIKFGRISK